MKNKFSLGKIVILLILALAPFVLAQCGAKDAQVASNRQGPTGPTQPSRLYFELIVTPHTIRSGSVVDVTVRVWDSSGNAVSGVMLVISSLGIDPSDAVSSTGINGMGGWVVKIEEPAGAVVPITVTVEDQSLSAPVQVLSTG